MQAKLTPEQKLEIVEAVQAGTASMTELARKYGVSSSTLSYNYFKLTKNKIKPQYFLSQTDKETIVQEGQLGKHTIKDLASKYGVTPIVIRRVFREITGSTLFPKLNIKRKKFTPSQKVELVEDIQSGKVSMTELAKKYNTSISTISYHYFKLTGDKVKPQNVLSHTNKEALVKELDAELVTILDLANRYGVHMETNERAKRELYQAAEKELTNLIEEVEGIEKGGSKELEEKIYEGIFKIGRRLMEGVLNKGNEAVPTKIEGKCGHEQKLLGYRGLSHFT